MKTNLLSIFSLIIFLTACSDENISDSEHAVSIFHLPIPEGFPEPEFPTDNQLTKARIELGKKLFYDTRLSIDSTIACVSCHIPNLAFSDSVAISPGVKGKLGFRNAPTLANVAYLGKKKVNKDGGVVKLDLQAVVPIEDEMEMGFTIAGLSKRLQNIPEYEPLFQKAYNRGADPFSITRALGSFLRTLISGNSRYDQYVNQKKENALTESEKRGKTIFFDKVNCGNCHHGHNLTNYEFANVGVHEKYADRGRARITLDEKDDGKFRVPTLRNIALTAPYMHDGSIATLEEVIEHYIIGGKDHPNKDPRIQPINLTEADKVDLIHFFESLTDSAFINNQNFLPNESNSNAMKQ